MGETTLDGYGDGAWRPAAGSHRMKRLRVAVCFDFREERWPSMDRVAETLVDQLRRHHADALEVTPIVPRFARRAMRALGPEAGTAYTVDRLVNRLWDYPRAVAKIAHDHDVFHIIDHSYAQLVHRLPADRSVVTCHDLDTFRSLLSPAEEQRSPPYNAMMRHVLSGLQRAARVTCDTAAVRDELVSGQLIESARLTVAPIGVGPEFSPAFDPEVDRAVATMIGSPPDAIELLHVGSSIARKRIDVLLRVVAAVAADIPDLRLVRVGGAFTAAQRRLAHTLGLDDRIVVLERLNDRTLAAVYRRAALVVLTSDREGFGLPLIEAMACGTPVVASDLKVLREVGGDAITYCAPGDVSAWSHRIVALLAERRQSPDRWRSRVEAGLGRAGHFSWERFAAVLARVYGELA